MSKTKEDCTKATILEAAKQVFVQKGYTGTRMQEIADKASINKAMLHYYFGSKEKLFRVILTEAASLLTPMVARSLSSSKDVKGKLEDLITNHIAILLEHPHLPMFVMYELSQNQGGFMRDVTDTGNFHLLMLDFAQQVIEEGEAGKIRRVDPIHLLINVMSMTVFPFVMPPMVVTLTKMPGVDYSSVLEQRTAQIIEFVHSALRP